MILKNNIHMLESSRWQGNGCQSVGQDQKLSAVPSTPSGTK
jgi:hypothetical protein